MQEHRSARKAPDEFPECPAFSNRTTTAPRKRKTKETLCITGVEQPYGLKQHLQETRPVVATIKRYIPIEQSSAKVAVSRGGGDSGFQTRSSTTTGNGDNPESDNGDVSDPPSIDEGEHLPEPTACQGNGKVESEDGHDSLPNEVILDQGTPPCDSGPECPEREALPQPGEGETGAEGKGRTKAENMTSHTKRPSNFIPGQSKVQKVFVGATAQKQPITHATANFDTGHQQFGGKWLPSPIPESDQSKDNEKNASLPNAADPPRPAGPDIGSATDQPVSGHSSKRVRHAEVGEPPPVPWIDNFQDMVTIEDDCVEVNREGYPVQLLMVHMEPHDYDLPTPYHPWGYPHLPLPAQESEAGRSKLSQLVLPYAR